MQRWHGWQIAAKPCSSPFLLALLILNFIDSLGQTYMSALTCVLLIDLHGEQADSPSQILIDAIRLF